LEDTEGGATGEMIDTLKLSKALQAARMPEEQADAIAGGLAEALHEDTVTKADLRVTETQLRDELGRVKTELLYWIVGLLLAQTGLLWAVLHK
jgi:hypothetical protein